MIFIFDIVKLIMSFFVAAIHLNPLLDISRNANFYLVDSIGRIAVPIFFSIAGYLLYRKINKDKNNCNVIVFNYLKRIFMIYLIWSIIYYIPFSNFSFSFKILIKFVFNFFIKGVYSQLWYMQSLIVGVILSIFFTKRIGIRKTLGISFLFYIISLLMVPYYPYIKSCVSLPSVVIKVINIAGYKTGRNGLFFGMFFITLGGITLNKENVNIKNSILGLIVSFIFLLIESSLIRKLGGEYFGMQLSLFPLTYFSMCTMIWYHNNTKKVINTMHIRNMSFLIYLIHEFISYLYRVLFNDVNIILLQNHLTKFIIVMVITILLSELIIYLSKKEKFKILKKIY